MDLVRYVTMPVHVHLPTNHVWLLNDVRECATDRIAER